MDRLNKRPTIKQVALASGVSTQTVSRVINNRPDVATETRERVMDVIKKIGYQPSALARSLIQQRSYTLGVVTAGLKFIGPIPYFKRNYECSGRSWIFTHFKRITPL